MTSAVATDAEEGSLPPLSLYIHIPWCVRKCPYCDFNSHVSDFIPEKEYVSALIGDLHRDLPLAQGRKLASIFFGGGTPSLFSGPAIADIVGAAEKALGFQDDMEITLEANPGTVEQQKYRDFFQAGINRLSIGVQSFQPQHLAKLGRIHNADEAIRAVDMAREAGFHNINIDLMHGLPQQSTSNALQDLHTAISLQPQHLSWYQLTVEPNTAFYSQPPSLPEDDTLAQIQEQGHEYLCAQGYQQYEISAYCRSKNMCKHNLNYWEFGDYLGIGAGAHGKITAFNDNFAQIKPVVLTDNHCEQPATQTAVTDQKLHIYRMKKTRLPRHYLDKNRAFTADIDTVERCNLPLEFMMNTLRLTHGVPTSYFTARTGIPLDTQRATIDELCRKGLLEKDKQWLQTTPLGQRFLNSLLEAFMTS